MTLWTYTNLTDMTRVPERAQSRVEAASRPSGTKTRSCRPHVLVDEPTDEISPFDVGHAVGLFDGSETLGYLQLQSWMRASPVVVLHIDPKDAIEMPRHHIEE